MDPYARGRCQEGTLRYDNVAFGQRQVSGRARYDIFVFEFATFSAVSGSVCKGQVSWRARYDTLICRSLRVQLDNFAFEFATFSAVSGQV